MRNYRPTLELSTDEEILYLRQMITECVDIIENLDLEGVRHHELYRIQTTLVMDVRDKLTQALVGKPNPDYVFQVRYRELYEVRSHRRREREAKQRMEEEEWASIAPYYSILGSMGHTLPKVTLVPYGSYFGYES